VLGDDDGFLPSTLDTVRKLVAETDARIIAWEVHTYWWPDTIAFWHRNKLYVSSGNNNVVWIDSRAALIDTYRNPVAFGNLPMIYNGFVHREVINSVIDRFGAYFVPADMSPDVTSGIINLAHTSRYLYSFRPLAVRGNSRRSNGTSHWARAYGKEQQKVYQKEEGKTLAELFHPSMNASPNCGFIIATTKLHLKDLLFPYDPELQLDLGALVKITIADLNREPESYDENLADALELAERIKFTVEPAAIPAKETLVRHTLQGPAASGNNIAIGINCDLANVFDVAAASRLAEAISPPLNLRLVLSPSTEQERKAG